MKKTILITLAATLIAIATFSQTKMSNKELVKTAVTDLFVKGDVTALDKYWAETYIQHNPQVPNGRDAIKKLVTSMPANFKYEMGLIMADGDFVMIHGRYTGFGPKPMVAVDIFRVENGKIAEHWDVLQDEVPAENTASKNPMFSINK